MKNNVIIDFHLSTGDNFTMYAAVCCYQKMYNKVYIFSLYRNIEFVNQIYKVFSNIHIITVPDKNYNNCITPQVCYDLIPNYINNIEDYDILIAGYNNNNWHYTNTFWRTFYQQLNLPYEIRYDYMAINRNLDKENEFYNMFTFIYGTNYIFTHDHRQLDYTHYRSSRPDVNINLENDIPIFHPNINYYSWFDNGKQNKYYLLWNEDLISKNIMDYGKIIENAKELHITNSSFFCLMPYLNIEHVKIKKMYNVSKQDAINYHSSFNQWCG